MKRQPWYSAHSRRRMFGIIACAWIAAIGLSYSWNWYQIGTSASMYAEAEARASYDKDLVYRRWSAIQGGVYIPPTEATPPNPYLSHIPDRDLVTTGGKQLTLVNPAYMTRQVHALGQEQYGALGHITSLTPLNPNNIADPWETQALRFFEAGGKEVVSKETINGQLHLRFMRPLITEKPCLKCHAAQGYKEGEIRGGISVSVPFSPYAAVAEQQRKQLLLAHLLISCLGLLGLWKGNNLLRSSETALLQSEERLKSILDTALDGFCVLDMQGCFLEVSQTLCQILGYSAQELLTMRIADLEALETEDEIRTRIKKIMARGEDRFESRLRCKDARRIDVEVSVQIKPDANEQLVAFVRDITGRKLAENALLRKDALLRAMIRNLPFGFWARDASQRIIMQSDESVHLWGDLTLDQNLEEQFDSHTLEQWHANNRRVLAGEIVSEDCTLVIKGGEQRKFHNIVAPIREGEEILGILGINIDITERKQAEEERKTLQTQLTQAQKMQAIGTLAGGIAHDFNNILGAVLGYAEMARDASPPGSGVARDLDKVLEAGHRAAALVRQILAFSRQAIAERILLEPAHLVKETIKLLRPTLPSTITIKQRFDPAVQPIFADPTQIHQIVMNLCTNAFHAMEQTGGTLEISLQGCELSQHDLQQYPGVQPGKFVMLSVSDTGPGIAPEIRDKIFDPYFTTKDVGKGTGMGLAIIHGIVTNAGGFVNYLSELGKGSTFQVFFPATDEKVAHNAQSAALTPVGKERILLIDDENILAEMGQIMLERLGYEVTVCTNSLKALETFQSQPNRFDAVVTDQTMPGMTGLDLARRMLQIRPDLPIILCTGYSNLVNEEQAKLYGIKGFVMKPMTNKEIATLLRKVLDDT